MLALGLVGCGHAAPVKRAEPITKIALFPIENLTGITAPTKDLLVAIELALRKRVEVVGGDIVEGFLARHRLRWTGGIDAEAARAAREELGVDAVLITSLESYGPSAPPKLGVAMRLVAASNESNILWMDAVFQAGDESPGLLGLGLIDNIKTIQKNVVARLVDSLASSLRRTRPAPLCSSSGRFRPKVHYRSPELDGEARTIAVLPFLNESNRRGAGEVVALEFVRQLAPSTSFRVLEPGVVRDLLLRYRIIMEGGVNLEATRLFLGAMGVDLILGGVVVDYSELGAPKVRFTATMLEGHSGEVVWQSTSYNKGDDGVWFFDFGKVGTVGDLTCRMVRGISDRMPKSASSEGAPASTAADALGGAPGPEWKPSGSAKSSGPPGERRAQP